MSTTIYSEDLPITERSTITRNLSIVRYARKNNEPCKCGYQITIGDQNVSLDAMRMREFVNTLKVFFGSEEYP